MQVHWFRQALSKRWVRFVSVLCLVLLCCSAAAQAIDEAMRKLESAGGSSN